MKTNTKSTTNVKLFLRAILATTIILVITIIDSKRSLPVVSLIISISIFLLISGWWVWRIISSRRLPNTPITLLLNILLIAVIISTIFSVDSRRSLDGTIAIFSVVLFFFLLCDLLLSGWDVKIFEIALIIYVGILLIIGFYKTLIWYWSWYQVQVPDYPLFLLRFRLFGLATHPNNFAMLIYIVLPFVVLRLYKTKSFLPKLLLSLWLILATINLFFVNSRGGLIATIIAIIISLLWIFSNNNVSLRKDFREWTYKNKTILGFTSFLIGLYLILTISSNIISPAIQTLHHGAGITAGRANFWKIAIDMISKYPITGAGLGTYARFYVEKIPVGQFGWIAPHAHNLYLDISAQIGIIGLIIFGSIVFTSFFRISNNKLIEGSFITKEFGKHNYLLVASYAGLLGFSAHSIVDVTIQSHTIIPVIILLAINFSSKGVISGGRTNQPKVVSLIPLFLLFPLFIYLFFSQNTSHKLLLSSIENGIENNWSESIDYLEQAASIDKSLSFYDHQRGYAYASLYSTTDSKKSIHLAKAINLLKDTYEKEPKWIPNAVNLAYLLDYAGNTDEAVTILETLPENWRISWPISSLFLGVKYQSLGDITSAEKSYKIVIDQNYWLKDSIICMSSSICLNSLNSIVKDEIDKIHELAIISIEQGNPNNALETLERIPINNSPAIIWIDRAAAHIEKGEFRIARYELRVAASLNALSNSRTRSYFALTAFKFFMSQHEYDKAISILESVVKPRNASNNYSYFLFQRFGFPNNLLPQLILMESNEYDLRIYQELYKLYVERGSTNDANWTKNQLEEIIEMRGISSFNTDLVSTQ